MGGLRERNLVCDHGSEVLWVKCPEWQGSSILWKKCEEKNGKKNTHTRPQLAGGNFSGRRCLVGTLAGRRLCVKM